MKKKTKEPISNKTISIIWLIAAIFNLLATIIRFTNGDILLGISTSFILIMCIMLFIIYKKRS